ncbi:hypothetical protein ACEQ8H_007585 [Pleosporales sp. CAS-2024a]
MAKFSLGLCTILAVSLFLHEALSALVAINRDGWTATADSFQVGNEPAYVLDGNASTFWHSHYSPAPAGPLPHSLTIDMGSSYTVQAVGTQPRPAAIGNGRIGGHSIHVSLDNITWQLVAAGTYSNDATAKMTTFVARQARYVKITATTEAQAPSNPWTSIAEVNVYRDVVNGSPTPYTAPVAAKGLWEKTIDFPLIPVAVSLLTNGKVLVWSSYAKDNFGGDLGKTQTGIFDPTTGESSELQVSNTKHDMFCPGISMDFDGRTIVTGGDSATRTSIYDPSDNTWISGPDMTMGRGYQSSATCSDGRMFTVGGSWSGPRGGKNGEIFDPSTNKWSRLPGALVSAMLTQDAGGVWRADNHAWLFGWKNNTVFQAGPSLAMNWYDTTGNGSTTAAGPRLDDGDSMNGNAVMYDAVAGKILTAGGAASYEKSNARRNAYVVTIGGAKTKAVVEKTESMTYARSFANAVVLPDGTVFVTGGQAYAKPFTDGTSALTPELWNPSTGKWTQLNAMAIPRNYHSTAILMPDATVFNGGGGLCGDCTQYGGTAASNHFDAEIFTPPYLLNQDGTRRARPTINSVASVMQLGSSVSVTTSSGVASFSLIRFGTATHTVDTDQRRIALSAMGSGSSFMLTVPADPGVALPGYWMLFAMDGKGTPSVGSIVKLTI